MRLLLPSIFFLCAFLAAGPISAEEAVQQPLEVGPSGQAYLDSVRYSRVQTDVAYFDPTGAVPRLETGEEPEKERKPDAGGGAEALETIPFILVTLAAAILIGLAIVILRGSNFALSLQGEAPKATRTRRTRGAGPVGEAGPPADLQAILATTDRRRALVMLTQAALARTVAANGVLFQPSWTLRDALRQIPKSQWHLDALRQLVMKGEQVLFGNHDVTEAEFQAQVDSIRPLMVGGTA